MEKALDCVDIDEPPATSVPVLLVTNIVDVEVNDVRLVLEMLAVGEFLMNTTCTTTFTATSPTERHTDTQPFASMYGNTCVALKGKDKITGVTPSNVTKALSLANVLAQLVALF